MHVSVFAHFKLAYSFKVTGNLTDSMWRFVNYLAVYKACLVIDLSKQTHFISAHSLYLEGDSTNVWS